MTPKSADMGHRASEVVARNHEATRRQCRCSGNRTLKANIGPNFDKADAATTSGAISTAGRPRQEVVSTGAVSCFQYPFAAAIVWKFTAMIWHAVRMLSASSS